MDGQGDVCLDELGGAESGDLESQWDGTVTVGLMVFRRWVARGSWTD